jgi:hypothetical protein
MSARSKTDHGDIGLFAMRRVLASLTVGALIVVASGCGTTSAIRSSNGNKATCADFATYESWLQSIKQQLPPEIWIHHEHELAAHLEVDGPTAKNTVLATEANDAVSAIDAKQGQPLANQLNDSEEVCLRLGDPPPGSGSTSTP